MLGSMSMLAAALWLAACTAPTPAPAARQSVPLPAPPEESATPKPAPAVTGTGSEVAVETLPQDVRDYILKQRMCRHFRSEAAGSAALADAMCTGGDASVWKALIRKYQADDTVGSVLLAEKPFDAPATSP